MSLFCRIASIESRFINSLSLVRDRFTARLQTNHSVVFVEQILFFVTLDCETASRTFESKLKSNEGAKKVQAFDETVPPK